jgi:biopolymer transport protein ExbD
MPLTIDGDTRVPWRDVIQVVNIAKKVGIEKIEFAYGAEHAQR